MKHEDQIMGIVYGIMSATFILVVLSHFKWDSNWVSFLGSFFAGIITLIVMYYTNKTGTKNVKDTIESNEKLQKEEHYLLVENYIKQLTILWTQQKYELNLSKQKWDINMTEPEILATDFTTIPMELILNIIANIPILDTKQGALILDYNSDLSFFNNARKEYAAMQDIFQYTENPSQELWAKKNHLKYSYNHYLVELTGDKYTKMDELINELNKTL